MADHSLSLQHIRHSLAHVLASAVLEMFPKAKLGVGPVIEHGFFYDFMLPRSLTPEDVKKLEKRMRELVKQKLPFERTEMSTAKAKEFFSEREQSFKVELIEDIEKFGTTKASEILGGTPSPQPSPTRGEGEKINPPPLVGGARGGGQKVSLYKTGKFIDLCRGGHVENTNKIDPQSFKLDTISGAYWRGDEHNPQLQRIYGLAFGSAEELQTHLAMLAETEKRDHRKLGVQLDLFTFSDLVGAGLPMFTPKGTILRDALEQHVDQLNHEFGYQKVWIPHLTKPELYKVSGHWDKFADNLFHVKGAHEEFVVKPMNCPHHTQIYASAPRSYKELPIRFHETTTVYRDEKSGQLGGLTRVRCITQDDGHAFLRPDQIEREIDTLLIMQRKVLQSVNFTDYWIALSLRDPNNKKAYLGDDKVWEVAERIMEDILTKQKIKHKSIEGEAAFYGPKMDLMAKDSIGREWQLSTIQLDFNMPKRFGLEYTDEKGMKQTPVMIHRAFMGSTERFLGVLIEHFAGAFPVWLSPVQVYVASVGKAHAAAVRKLGVLLRENGLRVEIDDGDDTVGYKIRKAEKQKIPYMLVVGDKEKSLHTLTVRIRGEQKQPTMTVSAFIKRVKNEIENKI